MKKHTILAKVGISVAVAATIGACSAAPTEPDAEWGTLEMALQAQGSQGGFFQLAGTFVLDDPELTTAVVDGTEPTDKLTLSPRVGNHRLELCGPNPFHVEQCAGASDWVLTRVECTDLNGNPVPAELCAVDPENFQVQATPVTDAILSTPNPQLVSIQLNQTTVAPLQFYVPGQGMVNFARGTLIVDVDVSEGFPEGQACTDAVQCQSNVCEDANADGIATCQAATCSDGVQNGGEAGPDCGGPCATLCPGTCAANSDCPAGEACLNGVCLASGSCFDDADCPVGTHCDPNSQQCISSCIDDTQCPAGAFCDPETQQCKLASGSTCNSHADCLSGFCDPFFKFCL
jgi:hypothetical protein